MPAAAVASTPVSTVYVVSASHGLEGRHPLGGRVELSAHAAQRPVRLGGEQQDGERDLEADAPRGQPEATVTATSATDRVAISPSTDEAAKVTLRVSHLAWR